MQFYKWGHESEESFLIIPFFFLQNLQKRSTKHVLLLVVVILFITRLVSAAFGTGGPLDGGGPLHGAGQGGRRGGVLHVVGEAQLVQAPWRLFAVRSLVRALQLRAVAAAQRPGARRLVPLDPGVVVADDVLVVEAGQQRHLAFNPPEMFAGRVDLDALHSIIATVQFVLDLEEQQRSKLRLSRPAALQLKLTLFIP